MELIVSFVFLFIVLALYLLPTIIAKSRGSNQVAAIFVLNLLFGFTGIGWGIALVFAFINGGKNGN